MKRWGRVVLAPLTWLSVGVIAFALLELVPGDVVGTQLGLRGNAADREALRAALQLQGGVLQRLVTFLAHLGVLDFGRSLVDGRSVLAKVGERVPTSALVGLSALALSWCLAVPLALWCRRGAITGLMAALYAVPVPALAMTMLAVGAPYGLSLGSVVAAAVCLLPWLLPRIHAHVARALEESLATDSMQALRAAGASQARITRAALRVQALRLLTLLGAQVPALLSGVVLVEAIFGIPGLGLLATDALAARDQPVLLGLVLFGALLTIVSSALVDLAAPWLDPRLRSLSERT